VEIIVHLPIIYVMTFLIAAFFEKKSSKKQIFILLAFVATVAEAFI